MSTDIVLDAGTYKTVLYSGGKILLEECSCVSVDSDTYEPINFGNIAKSAYGKTSDRITTIFPIERGVISDYDTAEAMIVHFIKSAFGEKIIRPRIIVIVPSGVNTVQHHSLASAVASAGCRNISTIENTVATAVGLGIDFNSPHGSMIVDIGGGTTDVAVISMGGIVKNDVIRTGSIDFDDAIEKYVRYEKNILIGGQTSEYIKKTVGCAVKRDFDVTITAKGRNILTGLPEEFMISSEEVRLAIGDCLNTICKGCQTVLETTDPDIVSDISKDGLYLVGGGAKLYGLDKYLSNFLEIDINFVNNPLKCGLLGANKVLKNPKLINISDYQYRSIKNLMVDLEEI